MPQNRFSRNEAQRFYDLLGERYDWFSAYEGRAKAEALERLGLGAGQRVLNVGLGTGKEHQKIQAKVGAEGRAFGLDLSARMLAAAARRTRAPLCQADGGRLPFATDSFERLYCAYVLDLVERDDLPGWLGELRRVLRPGGRLVVVSLTEGVDRTSRAFVAMWKAAYAISPISCGGCRPLELSGLAREAGFERIDRKVVVQLGIPSEVIAAE